MRTIIASCTLLFVFFSGCKKTSTLPVEPSIELVSIGPTNVQQFRDVVTLKFKYKDGDGDVGEVDPDVPSLRVKDSRLSAPDLYHIPPLTPDQQTLMIQGEIDIPLNGLFLIGNGSQEVLTYSIVLVDRAGHYSNELVSPQITVHDTL